MVEEVKKILSFREIFLKSVDLFGTPQFIVVEDLLRERARLLRNYFHNDSCSVKIYYAYKANDLPCVCRNLYEEGFGAEVSSDLELQLALKLEQKDIIFNGPGKTGKELELAIRNHVIIIVDNLEELKLLNKIASNLKIHSSVAVRLNMPFLKDKRWSRFGIQPKSLAEFLRLARNEFVHFKGIHFHVGMEMKNPDSYLKNIKYIGSILRKLSESLRSNIHFIDIGGGFAVEGYKKEGLLMCRFDVRKGISLNIVNPFLKNKPMEYFAERIVNVFRDNILSIKGLEKTELRLEPGRWLVDPTIYLLTKILYIKENNTVIDADISLCRRMYNETHPILNLSRPSSAEIKQRLYGCSCRPDDMVSRFYYGYKARKDEVICLSNVGAYNGITGMRFLKPSPKIINLSEGKLTMVARAETFEERYRRFF